MYTGTFSQPGPIYYFDGYTCLDMFVILYIFNKFIKKLVLIFAFKKGMRFFFKLLTPAIHPGV